MPTDVKIARSRRNESIQAAKQADTTVMLLSLIACLVNLALIALSPAIAAGVAAMGQY